MKDFILHTVYHYGETSFGDIFSACNRKEPNSNETTINSLCYELVQAGLLKCESTDDTKWYTMTPKGYTLRHRPCKPYWWALLKIRLKMAWRILKSDLVYHPKSDGFYLYMGHATLESNLACLAAYTSIEGPTYVRPISEFHDGRFIPWSEANSLLTSSTQTGK